MAASKPTSQKSPELYIFTIFSDKINHLENTLKIKIVVETGRFELTDLPLRRGLLYPAELSPDIYFHYNKLALKIA